MKRRQRRYTEESEIISEIDLARKEADSCLVMAVECDAIAEKHYAQIRKLESGWITDKAQSEICDLKLRADKERQQAVKLSRRRNTIEQSRLPKLKQLLAAFRTMHMSIVDDAGVVL